MLNLPPITAPDSFFQLIKRYRFFRLNMLTKGAWFAGLAACYAGLAWLNALPIWIMGLSLLLAGVNILREYKKETLRTKQENPWSLLAQDTPRAKSLYTMVQALSNAANIPMPKIVVTESDNLFINPIERFWGKHFWHRNYLFVNKKLITPPASMEHERTHWQIPMDKLLGRLAHEIAYLKARADLMSVSIAYLSKAISFAFLLSALWFLTPMAVITGIAGFIFIPALHRLFNASILRNNIYFADEYAALLLQNVVPVCQFMLPQERQQQSVETLRKALTENPFNFQREYFGADLNTFMSLPDFYYLLPGKTYTLFFNHPSAVDRVRHLCLDVHEEIERERGHRPR